MLGLKKSAVRLANLVRYFGSDGKLLAVANAYLLSGNTGFDSCAQCVYPVLSDHDMNHEHCWTRYRGLPELALELLAPRIATNACAYT